MFEIRQTTKFDDWLQSLRDRKAKARIEMRLQRAALGNLGDTKTISGDVSEMRIDYGPGYRVYFLRQGKTIILLLSGGDKSTQARDIRAAQRMAEEFR